MDSYNEFKKRRQTELLTLYPSRPSEYSFSKHKRKPWYFLTKKEIKDMSERHKIRRITGAKYYEFITQEKIKKWEKKHPCPQKDLFESQYMPIWQKEREEALEHIRDVVVSQYDKTTRLSVYTRCLINDKYTEYTFAGKIKDYNFEFNKATNVPTTIHNLHPIRRAATHLVRNQGNKLVAIKVTSTNGNELIIPTYAKAA